MPVLTDGDTRTSTNGDSGGGISQADIDAQLTQLQTLLEAEIAAQGLTITDQTTIQGLIDAAIAVSNSDRDDLLLLKADQSNLDQQVARFDAHTGQTLGLDDVHGMPNNFTDAKVPQWVTADHRFEPADPTAFRTATPTNANAFDTFDAFDAFTVQSIPVILSTNGNTTLVTGTAGLKIKVTSLVLVAAAVSTVRLHSNAPATANILPATTIGGNCGVVLRGKTLSPLYEAPVGEDLIANLSSPNPPVGQAQTGGHPVSYVGGHLSYYTEA